jgi:hypothetical protein
MLALPLEVWTNIVQFSPHQNNLHNRLICRDLQTIIDSNQYWRGCIERKTLFSSLLPPLNHILSIIDHSNNRALKRIDVDEYGVWEQYIDTVQLKDVYFNLKKRYYYLSHLDTTCDKITRNLPVIMIIVSIIVTLWMATRTNFYIPVLKLFAVSIGISFILQWLRRMCTIAVTQIDSDYYSSRTLLQTKPVRNVFGSNDFSINFFMTYFISKLSQSEMLFNSEAIFQLKSYIWVPALTLMLIYKNTILPNIGYYTVTGVPAALLAYCYFSCLLYQVNSKKGITVKADSILLVIAALVCSFGTGFCIDYWISSPNTILSWKGSSFVIAIWTIHVFIKIGILQTVWSLESTNTTILQHVVLGVDNACSIAVSIGCLVLSVRELTKQYEI